MHSEIEPIRHVCISILKGSLGPISGTKSLLPLLTNNYFTLPAEIVLLEKFYVEFDGLPIPTDWQNNTTLPPHLRAKLKGLCEFYSESVCLACQAILRELAE